jgi:hypothetical protein
MRTPIIDHDPTEASVFEPDNLLEGARRQNAMTTRPEDFEKGGHDGQEEALDVCARALVAALDYVSRNRRADKGQQP